MYMLLASQLEREWQLEKKKQALSTAIEDDELWPDQWLA